jgi:hypothetical protein
MFNMQISASILAFAALMGVSSAIPTPAGAPADACTTIYPTFMGQIQQDKPDLVATNSMDTDHWFALTEVLTNYDSQVTGQFQTIARFELPSNANSCNLHLQFPDSVEVTGFGNTDPNWSLFEINKPLSEDDMSWNKIWTDDSAIGILTSIKPHVANLRTVPFAYPNIGCSQTTFVFALEGAQDIPGPTDFEVYLNQPYDGVYGPYMTYGCSV